MTKRIPDSTIVATFNWPYSVVHIVHFLRALGYVTTATHVREVWDRARERGDLPPVIRPPNGFDCRRAVLVHMLQEGKAA
jgi:hypothetical protein